MIEGKQACFESLHITMWPFKKKARPLTQSDRTRRDQPLSVKAVGFIFGQGVTAWANWDRLIVRTEQNEVLLNYETQDFLLHSAMEFVNSRYLVVPFGTGIMVVGFKVYDFQARKWTLDIGHIHHSERGFCGAHPAAATIAVYFDGLELWNLLTARRSCLIPISDSPNIAALGGPDNKIAIGTWEKIIILELGRETLSAPVCTGDVEALAWNLSQNSLLCGDVAGNLVQVDADTLRQTHYFGRVCGGINKIRVSPDGKAALAIGHEGQAIFVDCERGSSAQQGDVFDAAFSAADPDCIFVAGLEGMRRLAISSLVAQLH